MRALGLVIAAWLAAQVAASAGEAASSHGLSVFGDLKYGPEFRHFDYVSPEAPKGGTLRLWALESYDTLNPFTLKGVPAGGTGLIYESLMARADDEPDAMYGLIAESAELAADRSWVVFRLRPEARWRDGSPITAEDVVFSLHVLSEKGHPRFKVLYEGVAAAEALGPAKVRFTFGSGEHRDLPLIVAAMPVFSKAYWAERDFAKTTLEPPMSSGPYRVAKVDPGRSITYELDPDYWGRELPVNRGRHNFGTIRYDYYRDRGVALEAFFAGEYDFREEFTSKSWATQYDKPAVRDGRIVREVLPDETPSGVQAFFINTRREKFQDRRVREALDLAFDFEWTNKNIFYGLYERMTSVFENSELAAKGPPSQAELALLEPFRGQVPEEVFAEPFHPPVTDGSGHVRRNLRKAQALFEEAGWRFRDGRLVNERGEPLTVEFLMFEGTFQRVVAPYIRNLERLGIDARMRIIDLANFQNRMITHDFDVIVRRYVMPNTPGLEQRNYWTSAVADQPDSLNAAGIENPVVDALVEEVIAAESREDLLAATRALDRVLMWNRYLVPHWYKGSHTIAYWDKFGRPPIKPRYARGVIDTWWVDPAKAQRIAARGGPAE